MSDLSSSRHLARERALQLFYEAHIKDRRVDEIVAALATTPDDYTLQLLQSAETNEARALELIGQNAHDWSVDRLALIDRLVMTLAIGELLMDDAPPVAVVLDEAVGLAKEYSTDASGSFVNGVLAACVAHLH
ncbi:MAG TPA: transcription antitermination factor NusB [Acidimicrobiales bacterium]|nr:transcription antitermination factor NusB [Acidimicrobiales bacterium]